LRRVFSKSRGQIKLRLKHLSGGNEIFLKIDF
jgi:hypothetical protein